MTLNEQYVGALGQLQHIFRDAPGHLAEDTIENRQLLLDTKCSGEVFIMGCGRPLADLPTLSIVPLLVNFVLDSTHGLPFGSYRTAPTADDTDRGYTGHLHTDGIGLIYMNARFYVVANGRSNSQQLTANCQWSTC